MGMAGDYVKAHEAMAHVVEESFLKMAKYCRFIDPLSNDPVIRDCLYNGRPAAHVCAREICPVLEEE